jgi:predicted nuclease with RNAse H fold
MMFVSRIREFFPEIPVTETHPKAVLPAVERTWWEDEFRAARATITLDARPDHERDAVISAIAAREGFEGRWKVDLSRDRFPCEQDPSAHWLAPVHYFWPE